MGFLGDTVVKNLPANAGEAKDADLVPVLGRSPGGGNGNPLQLSCLENPMDGGAWWATVHGVARVGHNFVTKPPTRLPLSDKKIIIIINMCDEGCKVLKRGISPVQWSRLNPPAQGVLV